MKKNQKKMHDYIESMEEQNHYMSESTFPVLGNVGRPKILGWFWVVTSIIIGAIMAIFFKSIFSLKDILPISIIVIVFYGIVLLQFVGGMRLIKKSTSTESFLKMKKVLIIAACSILIIIVLITCINSMFLQKENLVIINDVKLIDLIQENGNNYINIKNEKLILSCSFSDYHDIWAVKVTDSNATFKIKYKFNVLNSYNGRVVKVEKVQ